MQALAAAGCAALSGMLISSCDDDDPAGPGRADVVLQSHSATPAFVKGLSSGAQAYTLISSDDVLSGSPAFVFGGSADGMGLLSEPDGTFTLLVNHEDNFSVSRIRLDDTFKPASGEYVLNSTGGRWRLCSATLATPEEHGFGPVYLTVGESSIESMIHSLDPHGGLNSSVLLPALGKWNSENAVPLPRTAYAGKTVVVIGDDDSGVNGGQLALYVSNAVGDLNGGGLYVLARTNGNKRERDMVVGQQYAVEFKQIANQHSKTGTQIDAEAASLGAVAFGRTEDVDYRKGANGGREIYFNVTGQATTGVNADFSRTKWGRVYRLVLDAADPLRGTLEVLLDGDDDAGPANEFQNPDNILVTSGYVYIQEDSNGYGQETHDARVYQYNIGTRALRVVMELDHRRSEAKYNVGGASTFGSWEYGAMLDISEQTGIAGSFLLAIQPHTWRDARFKGVDGGTIRPNEDQGSQVLVVTGLER
ncbi:MAG: hypothetical protein ACREON_07780 [Gemmatimonadaceae bacterium]